MLGEAVLDPNSAAATFLPGCACPLRVALGPKDPASHGLRGSRLAPVLLRGSRAFSVAGGTLVIFPTAQSDVNSTRLSECGPRSQTARVQTRSSHLPCDLHSLCLSLFIHEVGIK